MDWLEEIKADDALLDKALGKIDSDEEGCCLKNIIAEEIMSDGDCEDYRLVSLYKRLDDKGKAAIDEFLVSLCGWSFGTLLKKYLKIEEE